MDTLATNRTETTCIVLSHHHARRQPLFCFIPPVSGWKERSIASRQSFLGQGFIIICVASSIISTTPSMFLLTGASAPISMQDGGQWRIALAPYRVFLLRSRRISGRPASE